MGWRCGPFLYCDSDFQWTDHGQKCADPGVYTVTSSGNFTDVQFCLFILIDFDLLGFALRLHDFLSAHPAWVGGYHRCRSTVGVNEVCPRLDVVPIITERSAIMSC